MRFPSSSSTKCDASFDKVLHLVKLIGCILLPVHTCITKLRMHHIDEGPKDGPILLAMHGQPVWCYLYSRMIPFLTKSGIRVIAPDLPGYGKSDKPASRSDYS